MIDLNQLKFISEDRKKENFHASDFGKPLIDLYFSFTGEPQTNPPEWYETLKWGAGKGVEEAMLNLLKSNGIVDENYNQKEHGRIELKYKDIQINGYIDAIAKDGTPIEIKSINNKNSYDISKYENGYPRDSYVGQLATYMEAKGKEVGYLFVASIDGLHYFWLECNKIGNGIYKCCNITINLYQEWDKWCELKNKMQTITEPLKEWIDEYPYKYDINELDWKTVSSGDISKARNGHKVIGCWQPLYSNWKDKIVKLQGTELGYTNQELSIIKQKTEGYTVWKKDKSVI